MLSYSARSFSYSDSPVETPVAASCSVDVGTGFFSRFITRKSSRLITAKLAAVCPKSTSSPSEVALRCISSLYAISTYPSCSICSR